VERLTLYEILIGILRNFPESKTKFKCHYGDILSFLHKESREYSILSRFTLNDMERGVSALLTKGIIKMNSATPYIGEFNPETIAHSYEKSIRAELFGERELKEVRDLSRKFAEEF
jgi:hypothetical protein